MLVMVFNKIILEVEVFVIYSSIRVLNIFALLIVQFQPLAFSPRLLEIRIIHSGKQTRNS